MVASYSSSPFVSIVRKPAVDALLNGPCHGVILHTPASISQ